MIKKFLANRYNWNEGEVVIELLVRIVPIAALFTYMLYVYLT